MEHLSDRLDKVAEASALADLEELRREVKEIAEIMRDREEVLADKARVILRAAKGLGDCGHVKPSRNPLTEEAISRVLTYYNDKTGRRTKINSEPARRLVRARIKEGATEADCRAAVDFAYREHWGTERQKYVHPLTIFSPSKFQKYVDGWEMPEPQARSEYRRFGE